MSKGGGVRASEIVFDGSIGLYVVEFKLQKAAALVVGNIGYAPCDLEVISVPITVATALSDSGVTLDIGVDTDTDSNLDGYAIENVAAGMYNLISETWVSKIIPKGSTFYASLPNVSGTTGRVNGMIICRAYGGA